MYMVDGELTGAQTAPYMIFIHRTLWYVVPQFLLGVPHWVPLLAFDPIRSIGFPEDVSHGSNMLLLGAGLSRPQGDSRQAIHCDDAGVSQWGIQREYHLEWRALENGI